MQRITTAIQLERAALRTVVDPRATRRWAVLIDVVAEMKDDGGILGNHVAVEAEVPLLIMLAGGKGEAQPVELAARRRQCQRASGAADRVADVETVKIFPSRLEPAGDVPAAKQPEG